MINNSATYLPYADERRIKLEASFELIDVDASVLATSRASTGAFFSVLSQTHDKIPYMSKKLATVEPDEWKLDGSYSLVKESKDNDEVGYWSQYIGDEDGNTYARVVYNFETPQTSRGVTVVFDDRTDNFAVDFKVIAYDGNGNEIASVEITDNDSYTVSADMLSEDYKRLDIVITKVNKPQHRIRIVEVTFGYLRAFSSDDIVSVTVDYETTIDAVTLPSNRLSLTIDNTDRRYNIINPTGIYRYLQKGQGLNASVLINGERVSFGRFYFESAKSDDNSMTVTITAYDKMYPLTGLTINVGASGTWTLKQAVDAIIKATGMSIAVDMPNELGSRVIGKPIPPNTSARDALRLASQAARCVCYFDRLDMLKFVEPVITEAVDSLDNDRMSLLPTITDTGLINSVEIESRDDYVEDPVDVLYTAQDIAEDEEERKLAITNPLVISNETAEWLLRMSKYRIEYEIQERGNPARELIDIVNIADVYGENKNGITVRQSFTGGKGLTGRVRAVTLYE